jgi:hypothetical protein
MSLAAVAAVLVAAASTPDCAATRVHGETVRAGPFVGNIVPRYDVVGGRFRLHVDGMRDADTGLSQKIPWWVSRRVHVTRRLVISGRRLDGSGRFRVLLRRVPGDPGHWVYPSNLSPPHAGCWRLRFHSGRVRARLTVLVLGRG